jgi:hypothetical protein
MWDDSCLGWPGRLHQVYDVIQKTMLVRVTVKAVEVKPIVLFEKELQNFVSLANIYSDLGM